MPIYRAVLRKLLLPTSIVGGAAPKSTTVLGVLAADTAFLFFVCLVSTNSVLVITDSWYVGFEAGACTTVVTGLLLTKLNMSIQNDKKATFRRLFRTVSSLSRFFLIYHKKFL